MGGGRQRKGDRAGKPEGETERRRQREGADRGRQIEVER